MVAIPIFTDNSDTRIRAVEEIIDYHLTDPRTLREALQTAGFEAGDGNKALAQVGDAALELALVSDGYEKGAPKGKINEVVSQMRTNTYLAKIGFGKKLDRYIYINPAQAGVVSTKTMATTVEAIIGAVYEDSARNMGVVHYVMAMLGLSWPSDESTQYS